MKAKYRVSNPEPSIHQLRHDISATGSGAGGGTLAEEELAQDDMVFVDDERVRIMINAVKPPCEVPTGMQKMVTYYLIMVCGSVPGNNYRLGMGLG